MAVSILKLGRFLRYPFLPPYGGYLATAWFGKVASIHFNLGYPLSPYISTTGVLDTLREEAAIRDFKTGSRMKTRIWDMQGRNWPWCWSSWFGIVEFQFAIGSNVPHSTNIAEQSGCISTMATDTQRLKKYSLKYHCDGTVPTSDHTTSVRYRLCSQIGHGTAFETPEHVALIQIGVLFDNLSCGPVCTDLVTFPLLCKHCFIWSKSKKLKFRRASCMSAHDVLKWRIQ